MNADAQVPGPPNPDKELTPQTPEKVLNLHIGETDFALIWKQGATVVSEIRVPKNSNPDNAIIRYPELVEKLGTEWTQNGSHRDPSDKKFDQAIMHSDNRTPFKEIIAVLDALYKTRRQVKLPDGKEKEFPVFNMTFSVR
jgi:hypothetical protein